jgi:hypothetical protein
MSHEASIVCVSEGRPSDMAAALSAGLRYSLVEMSLDEAQAKIKSVRPAAVVIAAKKPNAGAIEAIAQQAQEHDGPHVPILAALSDPCGDTDSILRITPDADPARLVARLASAMRIRSLNATVLRRATAQQKQAIVPAYEDAASLHEATVLVAGRGGGYPALCMAVAERVSLIGALSFETACRYLDARDIDGVVIGDGFSARAVEDFLDFLRCDVRYRDLPIIVADSRIGSLDFEHLANCDLVRGGPPRVLAHLLPLVRLHAFAARLRRCARSLETKGVVDPDTGLLTCDAFVRDLQRAVDDARKRKASLSLARFSFAGIDRRAGIDAARIVARLVRGSDFACQDDDYAMHVTFGDTDLRAAHVVARRIASVLKHTTLAPEASGPRLNPEVALVTRKASDTAASLLARVRPAPVAAE